MAFLYIAEFELLADAKSPGSSKWNTVMPVAPLDGVLVEQKIAIGAASIASAAFSDRTHYIRVETDSICSIRGGINPTATVANMRFSAGQTEYFGVSPGNKIAVIINT